MVDTNELCNECGAVLNPHRIVWLEYDERTDLYHKPGTLPADGLSLGCFAFGRACARAELKRTGRASGEGE